MIDKGYPHPLYSLDLVGHAAVPEDEPRYAILLPAGRLVVRAELRRRAADHGVLAVEHLVGTALAYQRLAPGGFERFGLGMGWARSVRYWRARMLEEDEVGEALAMDREGATTAARHVLSEARGALGHLALSARLAGLGDRVHAGPAPEGQGALCEALGAALPRCAEEVHGALLARSGFGARELTALRALADELPRRLALRAEMEARCRAQGDLVLVIRAALLGDAARLCQVAPQVLGAERCGALRVAPLLGRRGRVGARSDRDRRGAGAGPAGPAS